MDELEGTTPPNGRVSGAQHGRVEPGARPCGTRPVHAHGRYCCAGFAAASTSPASSSAATSPPSPTAGADGGGDHTSACGRLPPLPRGWAWVVNGRARVPRAPSPPFPPPAGAALRSIDSSSCAARPDTGEAAGKAPVRAKAGSGDEAGREGRCGVDAGPPQAGVSDDGAAWWGGSRGGGGCGWREGGG